MDGFLPAVTNAASALVEGLKLFVPQRCSALTRERMAHLNPGAAKWQLYELEEREDSLNQRSIFLTAEICRRAWSTLPIPERT